MFLHNYQLFFFHFIIKQEMYKFNISMFFCLFLSIFTIYFHFCFPLAWQTFDSRGKEVAVHRPPIHPNRREFYSPTSFSASDWRDGLWDPLSMNMAGVKADPILYWRWIACFFAPIRTKFGHDRHCFCQRVREGPIQSISIPFRIFETTHDRWLIG